MVEEEKKADTTAALQTDNKTQPNPAETVETTGVSDPMTNAVVGASKTEPMAGFQEKKTKQSFLEKFRFTKKNESTPDGSESRPAQSGSPEIVAETLYKELATIKGNDYIVLRIRKKMFVVLLGFLVLMMWLFLLGRMGVERFKPEWAFWDTQIQETAMLPEAIPAPTASPEAAIRMRVRDNSGVDGAGQQLVDFLSDKGYASIELADDQGSDYTGLMVVVKPGQDELRNQLELILSEKYPVSSPSAELTADSDFSAVILYGEGVEILASFSAQLGETPTPTETATRGAALR